MKIECSDKRMLVLELTDDDMKEMEITYRDMCIGEKPLEAFIRKLLNNSGLSYPLNKSCAMYAFPDCRGGCMMFLLFDETENVRVFETDDVSALLDCLKAVEKSVPIYTLNGEYRIIISVPQYNTLTVSEFMYPVGGYTAALYTDEHWKCLSNPQQAF